MDAKYRQIRLGNEKFQARVYGHAAGKALLLGTGWQENADGTHLELTERTPVFDAAAKALDQRLRGPGDHFLKDMPLVRCKGGRLEPSSGESLGKARAIALYFSAHWCPPCRAFTPVLADFYEEVQDQGLEIVFVSSDRSPADMAQYMKELHGDWPAVALEAGAQLKATYGVRGIPKLVVVRPDGSVITEDGRSDVVRLGPAAVSRWV